MTRHQYRIRREDDQRTITTLGQGADAPAMIAEAVAAEFEVSGDDLTYAEEFDEQGEPTGDELIKLDGRTIARISNEWR